jgi:hypothetical protein
MFLTPISGESNSILIKSLMVVMTLIMLPSSISIASEPLSFVTTDPLSRDATLRMPVTVRPVSFASGLLGFC